MFLLPFMFFLPIVIIFDRGMINPNEVAVSANGIHFYYDDPIMRYLDDDFIGWDEIKDIRKEKTKKKEKWVIEKKDKSLIDMNKFKDENLNFITLKWKEINQN
jgi:hypothetical protein